MATLFLILKLLLVLWTAKVLRSKWAFDQLSSLIAGWLFVLASQAGLILSLSSVGLLQQSYFLAATAVLASLLFWQTRSLHLGAVFFPRLWRNCLPLAAIVLVFSAMWLRSLFFYDYTWDAQTYGLPRLAIWLNSGSVLTHMPTLQLNLFVNEWNAELNSLAYGLASNSYLGFGFGNLEVLLVLFVALTWVALQLGAPLFWALCLSAVLGSTPAMLGLASTVKGDLLACVAFLIACGWLIQLEKRQHSVSVLLMLILSAILAVGSKISIALPAIAILAVALRSIGLSGLSRLLRLPRLVGVGMLISIFAFSSRFWINWFVYSNPLRRIDVEKAQFSFGNMLGNLQLAFNRMFGILDELHGKGQMWALAGSMGGAAWFIAGVFTLCIVSFFVWNKRSTSWPRLATVKSDSEELLQATAPLATSHHAGPSARWVFFVLATMCITTFASMTLSEPYLWTFRYFYPGIAVFFLFVGALSVGKTNSTITTLLVSASLLSIAINLTISSRAGEILPIPDLRALVAEVKQANTQLKRMSLFVKSPYQSASVEALGLDTDKPLHILTFKDLETSFIPFLGSHAQNKIRIVADSKEFIAAAAQPEWDVVVVLQKLEMRDPNLSFALEKQGYWIAVDDAQYVIGLPKSRVQLMPLSGFGDIAWTPWNSRAGVQLSVRDGMPEIKSESFIDAGFVSQDLVFNGPVLIKASFEGEISGAGAHAAHLSLHGKQPIITLPSGKYSALQSFQGTMSVPENGGSSQRLSFGLGGWAEGSGHLTMTNLEAYKITILDPISASITPQDGTQKISAVKIFSVSVAGLIGCVILGRWILAISGVINLSAMGISFIVGYGAFGLILLLSLRYLGSSLIGLVLFAGVVGGIVARKIKLQGYKFKARELFGTKKLKVDLADILIALTLLSWVAAVALTYIPLALMAENINYQLPEIFDLPKHLFAQLSLYDANTWPAPSPFFSTESFSYNYLFYLPSALIAKLVGSSLANFYTFGMVVIAIAIALPMTILDILRSITELKSIRLVGVLLATWVGGVTPLWINRQPAIGFFLYSEQLITSKIWIDELFQSIIFVPQHIYAVLCALVAIFLMLNDTRQQGACRKIFVAAMISIAGGLSSFILLPHIAVAFGLGLFLSIFLEWRGRHEATFKSILSFKFIWALLIPFLVAIPLLLEILHWSGGGGELINVPELSRQWFYVAAAMGAVVPFSMIGALLEPWCKKKSIPSLSENRIIAGMAILVVVGLFGLLFGGYPDAGIKSGLWVRITLIPIACVGIMNLIGSTNKFNKMALTLVVAGVFGYIAIINYPTARYFVQSSWRPVDPGIKIFISYIRSLPPSARIALFSPEQILVAMSGRQMDFNFSSIRADSYMPPEGRVRSEQFWREINDGDPKAWSELPLKYDYLIAPVGSSVDIGFANKFTKNASLGGYTVYKTNMCR